MSAPCLVQVPFDAGVRISLDTNLAMILENPGDTPLALAHRCLISAQLPRHELGTEQAMLHRTCKQPPPGPSRRHSCDPPVAPRCLACSIVGNLWLRRPPRPDLAAQPWSRPVVLWVAVEARRSSLLQAAASSPPFAALARLSGPMCTGDQHALPAGAFGRTSAGQASIDVFCCLCIFFFLDSVPGPHRHCAPL